MSAATPGIASVPGFFRLGAIVFGLLLAGAGSGAQNIPFLGLPLRCTPGTDCWISNHVDLDPTPQVRDYACGTMTYNGHNGTDFAIRDLAAMRAGIAVVAAAAGVVRAVRDGMPDVSIRDLEEEQVKNRECGNGVRIDHGGGWQTQYCHLRRGSVAVKPGQQVAAGQFLAMVGLSGQTEYPHLHLVVRSPDGVVDPFRGVDTKDGCGPGASPLWERAVLDLLRYSPRTIYNYGVAPKLPDPRAVREGSYRARRLGPDSEALVVWFEAFHVSAGDVFEIRIDTPDGTPPIEHRARLEKSQARIFRAFGRRRGPKLWPPGEYGVTITLAENMEAGSQPTTVRFSFEVR